MSLFNSWEEQLKPLIAQFKGRKHPLDYKNPYQLLVMVVLSAQDSDANINKIAPSFFEVYPNLDSLAESNSEALHPYISKVRNFVTKANWLIEIAQTLQKDKNIPHTMEELVALKGIGRKSANVIMRETGANAQGIIADLHVIRVAPRIGLITATADGNKVEKQLMAILPQHIWGEVGMAISFLGREICRPTNPKCDICVMQSCCEYFKTNT